MPLASDVPRSGPSRSIAATTSDGSLVGTWTENPLSLNVTTPIRTEAGLALDEGPRRRLRGLHPGRREVVAAMLPETSKARITVPSMRGTPITLCGRASETTRIVRPATTSRQGAGGGCHGDRPVARLGLGDAPRRRSRRRHPRPPSSLADEVERDSERDREEEEQHRRPDEGHRLRPPSLPLAAMRTIARTRSSSVDSRERVHAGALECVERALSRAGPPPRETAGGSPCRACPRRAARRSRHPP